MTQPCHKDTTLNQQCCDNKHKDRRGERNTVTPPHFPTHNKHSNTRQKRNKNDTKRAGQREGERDNARCQTQPKHGAPQHTPHPPFNRATGQTTRGTQTHRRGTPTFDGESVTLPPFTHHATHHHNGTPPSTIAPPSTTTRGGADRGYPTTRTPQTHTHHPHTTHLAMAQCTTRTAVLASTAMG